MIAMIACCKLLPKQDSGKYLILVNLYSSPCSRNHFLLFEGAAGFNSSMFAHLKRSWSWTNLKKSADVDREAKGESRSSPSKQPRKRRKTGEMTKETDSLRAPVIDLAPVSKKAKKGNTG